MKKTAIFSAFLGTLIEVYDFSIFAFLIPVLSEVFLSSQDKKTAINFTIVAYVISYAIKPLGGLLFGYFIDSYGRKNILLVTTFLMTFATAAIGLLPAHDLGSYGWITLVIFRFLQGLSISGEFTSAIIFAVEQGEKKPGFWGCFAFIGGSIGLLSANLTAHLILRLLSPVQLVSFGWRLPFLLSLPLCAILLIIRNKFKDCRYAEKSNRFNFIKANKRRLATVFLISSLSASAFYITFVFMPLLLSTSLNLHSHADSIAITLLTLLIYIVALPIGGAIADNVGIVRQIKLSSIMYLGFSYLLFYLLPNANRVHNNFSFFCINTSLS